MQLVPEAHTVLPLLDAQAVNEDHWPDPCRGTGHPHGALREGGKYVVMIIILNIL